MKNQSNFRRIIYFFALVVSVGSPFSRSVIANPTPSLQGGVSHSTDEDEQKESSASSQASANSISNVNPASIANLTPNTNPFSDSRNLSLLRFLPQTKFPDGTLFSYVQVVRFPIYNFLGIDSLISFRSKYDRADFAKTLPFYSVIEFENKFSKINHENIDSDPDFVDLLQLLEVNPNQLDQNKLSEINKLKNEILELTPQVQQIQLNVLYEEIRNELNRLNSYARSVCNENNPCSRLVKLMSSLGDIQVKIIQKIEELNLGGIAFDEINLDPVVTLNRLKKTYFKLVATIIHGGGPLDLENGPSERSGYLAHSEGPPSPWVRVVGKIKKLPKNIAAHRALFIDALEFQDNQLFLEMFLSDYQTLFKSTPLPVEMLAPFFDLGLKLQRTNRRISFFLFFDRQFIN